MTVRPRSSTYSLITPQDGSYPSSPTVPLKPGFNRGDGSYLLAHQKARILAPNGPWMLLKICSLWLGQQVIRHWRESCKGECYHLVCAITHA